MRNIIRLEVILKLILVFSLAAFVGCEKGNDPVPQKEEVSIVLDVDQLSLESASVRVRHNGSADLLWVYMNTMDLESDAASLIENKISKDLELTGEIVANRGQNKSLTMSALQAKSYYRFICSAIDEVTGLPYGDVAEITYRTRRDPSVFEMNDSWTISRGERTMNNQDKTEYDNFICESDDEQTYVVLTLKDSDFEYYYKNDLRSLFEDYQSSFGFEEGSSKWKSVLSSGDITWSEQRLRSGDWTAYMIGIDSDGELSGLYQLLQFTVEQEVASAEYNRWLGTWMVSDKNGEPLFEIQIIPSENNMWYYMAGWESSNVFGFDTYDPALMPELYFDKETGKMLFISQYVNSMVSGSETVDFYFTGTFTYGNTYVLGDQVLNLRMAESTFVNSTYSEAAISSLTFQNSGMEFPIESICYMYYNGSQLGSISLAPPTLPLTMTKKVTE
ncbi:MAG: hypothetical protein IIU89_04315 [Bacteroidales bacterium]|nr:hypothetical protein [Bacteroidales bacterium]